MRADETDPYELLMAMLDRSLTDPVKARESTGRWKPATAEAYAKAVADAKKWWSEERKAAREGSPVAVPDTEPAFMPWPPDRLARYVTHLAQRGMAVGTIRKVKSAILAWHRLHGLPLPDGVPALAVLQRHQHSLKAAGIVPKRAEPITFAELLQVISAVDRTSVRGQRDAAIALLTFGGMLTPTTLANMPLRCVRATPAGLWITRPDDTLVIRHWSDSGIHHPEFCPVEAVDALARYLRSRDQDDRSPLFRAIASGGRVAGIDPYSGQHGEGGRLSHQRFGYVLTRMLLDAGIPDPGRFNMMSLRIGGIVRRRLDGATVDELAVESGLSTVRSTLLDYVRAAEHLQLAAKPSPVVTRD